MNGNDVSREAQKESLGKLDRNTIKRNILEVLSSGYVYTAHEIAVILYRQDKLLSPSRQSVQPRLTELKKKNKVEIVGRKYDKLTKINVSAYRMVGKYDEQTKPL